MKSFLSRSVGSGRHVSGVRPVSRLVGGAATAIAHTRALSGAGTIASRAFVGSSRRFAAVSRVVLASRTCFGAGIGRFSARYKRTARAVRGRSSSISKRPLDRRAIRAVERAVRVRSQGPHAASARARGPADGRVDGAGGCWSARSTIGRLEPTRDRTYAGSRCALEAHLDAPILGLKRSDGRRTMVQWTPKRLIRGRQSAVHCDLNAPQETMRVIGRLQVPNQAADRPHAGEITAASVPPREKFLTLLSREVYESAVPHGPGQAAS